MTYWYPQSWSIRTAYPGTLGVEKPEEIPTGCDLVEYQDEQVRYGELYDVMYCGPVVPPREGI